MNASITNEKLVSDLKNVAHDAEELIKATAGEVAARTKEARERLGEAIESAKETCRRLEEKTVAGAKVADKAIREHPYQSAGIAFAVGLLIGVLINRRNHG